MNRSCRFLLALLLMSFAILSQAATDAPVKVVYHLNEGLEQSTRAMRNIRNHLSVDPSVKIVVVTHAAGMDFLLDGAKDKNGNPFDATVQDLVKAWSFEFVDIRCSREIFLKRRLSQRRKSFPPA